ncbi:MAG: GIY-YIG nuclease family protein [Candidatus Acidiferrales bacterium]
MPAFVYILRNETSGRHYIGSTNDMRRRLADHARGNTPSTRNRGPWKLVYSEECRDLTAARKREREIKSFKGGLKFKALFERSSSS